MLNLLLQLQSHCKYQIKLNQSANLQDIEIKTGGYILQNYSPPPSEE